jgi:hypothetical protein
MLPSVAVDLSGIGINRTFSPQSVEGRQVFGAKLAKT